MVILTRVPDLFERIDRIIDCGEDHNLGRAHDLASFWNLIRELWREFGDIYDSEENRFLGLRSKFERTQWLKKAIRRGAT